jgi:hypothetical protein
MLSSVQFAQEQNVSTATSTLQQDLPANLYLQQLLTRTNSTSEQERHNRGGLLSKVCWKLRCVLCVTVFGVLRSVGRCSANRFPQAAFIMQ